MSENITKNLSNIYTTSGKVVYLTQYHIIWCPKYKRNLLTGNLKIRLEEIIEEISNQTNSTIKSLEIKPNSVHIFISVSYKHPINKIIKMLKGRSSNLLRKEFPELLKMPTLWSRSFFLESIGKVSEKTIKKYIEDQWKKK